MSGDTFGLSVDPFGRLLLIDSEGNRHVGVEPIRAFPIGAPQEWVSLVDDHGHEVLMIEDLASLTEANRRVLLDELSRREFVPEIAAVVRVSGESSPSDWDVETDRGAARFTLDSDESIRRLGPHRILITDARGMRYHIRDVRSLDAASRRRVERYL